MKKSVFIVLIIVLVIWGQSAIQKDFSNKESLWIKRYIADPITDFLHIESLSHADVRKIAHSIEYAVLGVAVFFFWNGQFLKAFYTGFTVAFLDESIQGIAGRSPELGDVWIDLAGVAFGVVAGMVLIHLRRTKKG